MSARVHTEDDARAAVREHVERGVDWIKLFPGGAYAFLATGEARYVMTYPLPVLQALIDEAHRLGRKTACHVLGGEGQRNALTGEPVPPPAVTEPEPPASWFCCSMLGRMQT